MVACRGGGGNHEWEFNKVSNEIDLRLGKPQKRSFFSGPATKALQYFFQYFLELQKTVFF